MALGISSHVLEIRSKIPTTRRTHPDHHMHAGAAKHRTVQTSAPVKVMSARIARCRAIRKAPVTLDVPHHAVVETAVHSIESATLRWTVRKSKMFIVSNIRAQRSTSTSRSMASHSPSFSIPAQKFQFFLAELGNASAVQRSNESNRTQKPGLTMEAHCDSWENATSMSSTMEQQRR